MDFKLARWDNMDGSSAGCWLVVDMPGVVLISQPGHKVYSHKIWKLWAPSLTYSSGQAQKAWPNLTEKIIHQRQAWIKERRHLQATFSSRSQLLDALRKEQNSVMPATAEGSALAGMLV